MLKLHSLFWVLCICLQTFKFANAACTITINEDLTNPQVLVLRPEGGSGNDAFFIPNENGIISVNQNQVVHLNCGGRNFRVDGTSLGTQSVNATCTTGNLFNVLGSNKHFSAFSCSAYPIHSARFTGQTCLSRYREFQIGFEVNNRFITTVTGCFDQSIQATLYTVFELLYNVGGYQVGFASPTWTEGDFFSVGSNDVNTLYTRNTQRVTINNLLGLDVSSTKYVHGTNNYYLARGHLAAKAYFIFGNQQRATFYFVNASPQWQMVNQANWGTVEANIRSYVINKRTKVQVYTGIYGVSTLPHEQTGQQVGLYLYVDGNNNKAIPVPQLYWNAVYEPTTQKGIVFISVNNPYYVNVSKDVICTNICSQINWLTWSPTDITRGYSYCCTVDAFRAATGLLPNFQVSGVLT